MYESCICIYNHIKCLEQCLIYSQDSWNINIIVQFICSFLLLASLTDGDKHKGHLELKPDRNQGIYKICPQIHELRSFQCLPLPWVWSDTEYGLQSGLSLPTQRFSFVGFCFPSVPGYFWLCDEHCLWKIAFRDGLRPNNGIFFEWWSLIQETSDL